MASRPANRGPFQRQGVAALAAVTTVIVCGLSTICIGGCSRARLNAQVTQVQQETDASKQELERIDPSLVKYHETGRFHTGFAEARGLAIGPDALLHVAGDEQVRVFTEDGALQREFAVSAAPHCLAVDDAGTIFVGLRDRVEIYAADGQLQAAWNPMPGRAHLTCVDVSGDEVYVADAGERVILRCDRSGQLLGRIGQKDEARGVLGLIVPSPHLDVAVGTDGLVRVSNPGRRLVETYTPEGELKASWGRASQEIDGFCGCCNPTDIALLPDGRIVTSEKGLPRVKVYGADGQFDAVVAGPQAFAKGTEGLDLAVDAQGRVFVLDPKANEIVIFEPNEPFVLQAPSPVGEVEQ